VASARPVWDATQKVRRIQQDKTNPPPVKDARINNLAWANMSTCGWDVAIVEQTVNSPNFNTSDLACQFSIRCHQQAIMSSLSMSRLPERICLLMCA